MKVNPNNFNNLKSGDNIGNDQLQKACSQELRMPILHRKLFAHKPEKHLCPPELRRYDVAEGGPGEGGPGEGLSPPFSPSIFAIVTKNNHNRNYQDNENNNCYNDILTIILKIKITSMIMIIIINAISTDN